MHIKFSRAVPLGTLAALLFSGCSAPQSAAPTANSASGASTTAASAVSSQPFRVAFNQWIGFTGVMLAREKGFFKDAGLNVEWKEFSGPSDGVPPLLSGQLEAALTTADTPILLSRPESGLTLQNVYAIDTSNGADGIVAGKGIANLSALQGKTIAATKGQVNEFLLLRALAQSGLKPDSVTITNMDADTGGAAVLAGKVPAAVTWEPWLSKATAAGGSIVFSSKQTPNLIVDVATVSGKVAQERPADVKAFVAACAKGNAQALANPAEAAKIAQKYFGVKPDEAKAMLQKVKLYSAADNRTLMGTAAKPGAFGQTSKDIAGFFVSQKVMTQAPAQTNLFSPDFLPAP